MKKFHKRAAVFLTAATLAGLPAGAFFYSSPGRMLFRLDESSSIKKVNLSRKLPGKICWQAAWTQHLAMLQVL